MDLYDLGHIGQEYEKYEEGEDCPNCENGKLIKKYARNFDGNDFLGCSNYPRCNYSQTCNYDHSRL